MDKQKIKNTIIAQGVKNLKEYGYPTADKDSILTDIIYAAFFRSMLEDNKGKGNKETDEVIDELLSILPEE